MNLFKKIIKIIVVYCIALFVFNRVNWKVFKYGMNIIFGWLFAACVIIIIFKNIMKK